MDGIIAFAAARSWTQANFPMLVDGKIPPAYIPGQTTTQIHFKSRAAFPETGEGSTVYIADDEGTAWMWSGTGYYSIGNSYESVQIKSSTTKTIGELKTIVDNVNAAGRHVFFDLSSLGSEYSQLSAAYVCLVFFYNNGTQVQITDLIGSYVYDSGVAFDSTQEIATYCQENSDAYAMQNETVALISGAGAPTTSTKGKVGDNYFDTLNYVTYKCIAVGTNTYTWEPSVYDIASDQINLTDVQKAQARTNIGAQAATVLTIVTD